MSLLICNIYFFIERNGNCGNKKELFEFIQSKVVKTGPEITHDFSTISSDEICRY